MDHFWSAHLIRFAWSMYKTFWHQTTVQNDKPIAFAGHTCATTSNQLPWWTTRRLWWTQVRLCWPCMGCIGMQDKLWCQEPLHWQPEWQANCLKKAHLCYYKQSTTFVDLQNRMECYWVKWLWSTRLDCVQLVLNLIITSITSVQLQARLRLLRTRYLHNSPIDCYC